MFKSKLLAEDLFLKGNRQHETARTYLRHKSAPYITRCLITLIFLLGCQPASLATLSQQRIDQLHKYAEDAAELPLGTHYKVGQTYYTRSTDNTASTSLAEYERWGKLYMAEEQLHPFDSFPSKQARLKSRSEFRDKEIARSNQQLVKLKLGTPIRVLAETDDGPVKGQLIKATSNQALKMLYLTHVLVKVDPTLVFTSEESEEIRRYAKEKSITIDQALTNLN